MVRKVEGFILLKQSCILHLHGVLNGGVERQAIGISWRIRGGHPYTSKQGKQRLHADEVYGRPCGTPSLNGRRYHKYDLGIGDWAAGSPIPTRSSVAGQGRFTVDDVHSCIAV